MMDSHSERGEKSGELLATAHTTHSMRTLSLVLGFLVQMVKWWV